MGGGVKKNIKSPGNAGYFGWYIIYTKQMNSQYREHFMLLYKQICSSFNIKINFYYI